MNVAVRGAPLATTADMQASAKAPEALRRLGLVETLEQADHHVDDVGDVDLVPVEDDRREDGVLNRDRSLANLGRVHEALAGVGQADVDVVLGGECTLAAPLIDRLAARRGRPAVLWFDAHGDFNTPATSPSGFLGGMALAMACGRTPDLWQGWEPATVADEADVVHVGARSLDDAEARMLDDAPVACWPADRLRETGLDPLADRLAGLDRPVYAHVDVLDPEALPAVDYPEPGGLTPAEVAELVGAVPTDRLAAVALTAYNPDQDADEGGRVLIDLLADALA